MSELTFFRQARYDGGIRMGIELDRALTLTEDFTPGPPELEEDPIGSVLLWFIDIRCRSNQLPSEAEEAKRWFLAQAQEFQTALEEIAAEIKAGTDDDSTLLFGSRQPEKITDASDDLVVQYAVGMSRRLKGPELADQVRDVARHLSEYLARLPSGIPSGAGKAS